VRVGADTGGTFSDLVADDGRIRKVLTRRADPAASVADGLRDLGVTGPDAVELLAHGTTIATNALLEGPGTRVALVTTEGFADVIEIGRQDRPHLYDQWADRPPPLVPRDLRLEVAGRLDARGDEVAALDVAGLDALADRLLAEGVEAVAVCLLHADLSDRHERAVADALAARGLDVTRSTELSPEFREFERTVTTVANAALRPRCRPHLERVATLAAEVVVMTSAGGLVPVAEAARWPATLALSGPAAGARAAAAAARLAGFPDAVAFDMGGTSTDVCLLSGGEPAAAPSLVVAGRPIRLPALAIHTIGAGGGSLARLDPGGALAVGPASAGAGPGPACYGRGGTAPTVTDADLLVGRIPADATFPGLRRLDTAAARAACARAGVAPDGILRVVDAAMEQAVRAVTVERGVDPRGLALVAFGGAGPLHACAVAAALGMAAVLVPPRAGVLSAVGLLTAPHRRDLVRSWRPGRPLDELPAALAALAEEARALVPGDPPARVTTAVDARYVGQGHELTVPSVADFALEHERRNGFTRPDVDVEVVAVRATAERAAPLALEDLGAPPARRTVVGPDVVAEPDCTVWVPAGWTARVDAHGIWVLEAGR
jgi:N-methylhydantoinase A/oxoprolinase/acetone carboxylase beta subunit